MTNFSTINSSTAAPPPPPVAALHHSPYMSPLTAVLCLVALITIPMLSYTFFMAVRCRLRPSAAASPPSAAGGGSPAGSKSGRIELVCGVKYTKTAGGGGGGGGGEPCAVCLSALAEGEEIRQLGACGHAFHAACVDVWLYSHSSCPVCRAAVPVKRSKRASAGGGGGEDDFRHGLPDAATLM